MRDRIGLEEEEEEEGKMSLSFEGCFSVRDDVVGKSTSESSFFLSFFLCEKPSPPGLGLGDERSIAAPAMFGLMMMSFS